MSKYEAATGKSGEIAPGSTIHATPTKYGKSTAETLADGAVEAEDAPITTSPAASSAAAAPVPWAASAAASTGEFKPAPSKPTPGRMSLPSMPSLAERDIGDGALDVGVGSAPTPAPPAGAVPRLSSVHKGSSGCSAVSASSERSGGPRPSPRGSVFGASAQRGMGDDERKELQKVFASFDTDRSGHIDLEELGRAMANLGMPTTREKLSALLNQADEDKSGAIDFGALRCVRESVCAANCPCGRHVTQEALRPQASSFAWWRGGERPRERGGRPCSTRS